MKKSVRKDFLKLAGAGLVFLVLVLPFVFRSVPVEAQSEKVNLTTTYLHATDVTLQASGLVANQDVFFRIINQTDTKEPKQDWATKTDKDGIAIATFQGLKTGNEYSAGVYYKGYTEYRAYIKFTPKGTVDCSICDTKKPGYNQCGLPDINCGFAGAGTGVSPAGTGTGTTPPAGTGTGVDINVKLINPISAKTLQGFIKDLVNILLTIGIPIVALAFIYSGFLFVQARGDEEGLKKARHTFFATVIGAAILLGAWVLATAIFGTIKQIGGGGSPTQTTTQTTTGGGFTGKGTTVTRTMSLSASSNQISSGQTATIRVNLSPARQGETVTFDPVSGASITPNVCQTDFNGTCPFIIFTPSGSGSFTVSATSPLYGSAFTTINVTGPLIPTAGPPLQISAYPSTLRVGQTATIRANTPDNQNVQITFSTSGGILSGHVCSFGFCSVDFRPYGSGTHKIKAEASGYNSAVVVVTVTAQ